MEMASGWNTLFIPMTKEKLKALPWQTIATWAFTAVSTVSAALVGVLVWYASQILEQQKSLSETIADHNTRITILETTLSIRNSIDSELEARARTIAKPEE